MSDDSVFLSPVSLYRQPTSDGRKGTSYAFVLGKLSAFPQWNRQEIFA